MGKVFQSLSELGTFAESGGFASNVWITDPGIPLYDATSKIEGLWGTQPSVRKVVDYIARQIASTPIHVYDRVSDTDRPRVTDHPLAKVLSNPCPPIQGERGAMTAYRFWHSELVDWLMYDRWAAMKVQAGGGVILQRIPARKFRLPVDSLERVVCIQILGSDGTWKDYDPAGFVYDHGYTEPNVGRRPFLQVGMAGTSPMQAIIATLAEMSEAIEYRRQLWKKGAKIPGYIYRPNPWSSTEARDRFINSWKTFSSGGGKEGGTPILEDGMEYKVLDAFKPRDLDDLEGRRLGDIEVCSFFHMAPELIGARQGNYSNMDAFRQGLYRESLGPYYEQFIQAVNLHLTPDLAGSQALYAEYCMEAKLAGSFQEQAQVLSTATGAPWMTRSEARGRMNMPEIEEANHLVVPLNVLEGGQASVHDSGTQNLGGGKRRPLVLSKTRPGQTYEKKAEQVLVKFFKRQRQAVKSALGTKASTDYWDAERWNRELGADIFPLGTTISERAGRDMMEALAMDPDEYDVDRTLAYLSAMAKTAAKNVNQATYDALEEALAEDDPEAAVDGVFDEAEGGRSAWGAVSLVTNFGNWGGLEGGRQAGAKTKRWITGENARPEHAAMDGEEVGVDEMFSNGCMWPGDGNDSEYGCNCDLEIIVG